MQHVKLLLKKNKPVKTTLYVQPGKANALGRAMKILFNICRNS
jgi:hypothetical protein